MEFINKIEDLIGTWLKPVPHLPADWRSWLAKNAWWLTLVGVIISVFGLFGLLSTLSLFSSTVGYYSVYTDAVIKTQSGMWMASIYVSLALLIVTVVVEAMAISPLKVMKKKGWDLLFIAYLIGIASGVVTALINANFTSLISTAIGAAIGAYVLYEVRSHYK